MLLARVAACETSVRLLHSHAFGPSDEAAWNELGSDAEAPSVFAEPWLMRCSLAHCDPRHDVRLAVVEDEEGRWLGALPVTPALRQGRSPVPAWTAWRHANQFAGSPLVRRGQAERFWCGLLEGLGAEGRRVSLVLGGLPTDDPVTEALLRLCSGQGRVVIDRRIERACLRAGAAPHAKQRSRIRGLERKLAAEVGSMAFALVRDPDAIDGLLESFLALEQSGWKGRAGSALACAEGTRDFFLDACRTAAAMGRLEAATLSAGGQTVAITTQLRGAGWTYGFKAAYDETYARHAPGLLLLDRLTQAYAGRGAIDSCAEPGQQPVSRLWPERRELIDCRVALGGAVRSRLFRTMLACERVARGLPKGG